MLNNKLSLFGEEKSSSVGFIDISLSNLQTMQRINDSLFANDNDILCTRQTSGHTTHKLVRTVWILLYGWVMDNDTDWASESRPGVDNFEYW